MRPERHALVWMASLVVLVVLVALLSDALLPFVIGAIVAYFLDPAVAALQRMGLGRTLASLLLIGIAAMAVAAAAIFLVPIAAGQLRQLALSLPADLERVRVWVEAAAEHHLGDHLPGFKMSLQRSLGELAQGSSGLLSRLAQALWSRGLAIVNIVSLVLVTPVVAFYLLRDWRLMLAKLNSWLPLDHAVTIRRLANEIDAAVGAFVRGQGTICLILGAFYAIALGVIGLRYGLVIGLTTGLLAFVPMIGWALGVAMSLLVALTQSWPDTTLALQVLGVFFAAMALDSGLLSPLIVGQKVGLHPVALMLSLFVFSAVLGLLGTLLAVPVAAALAVLVRFVRDRYLASSMYLGRMAPEQRPAPAPRLDT